MVNDRQLDCTHRWHQGSGLLFKRPAGCILKSSSEGCGQAGLRSAQAPNGITTSSSVHFTSLQPRLPMPTGSIPYSSGTRLLDGRRRDRGLGFTSSLSRSFRLLSSPTFLGASMHFGSTFHVIMAMHDARGYLVWTLLGIIFFLRSLY